LGVNYFRKRTRSVFELIVDDGTARLHCRWWNLPFMERYFQQGHEVFVFGKLHALKPRTMDHPETEVIEAGDDSSLHLNRIVPIYPLTEGLSQRWLRTTIWRVLEQHQSQLTERWPQLGLTDLLTRTEAIRRLHIPESLIDADAARQRLALDEFIELQL